MPSQKTILAVTAASAAIILAGCAHTIHGGGNAPYAERNEVPIAANFTTTTQLKLQAAEHWRRVAQDSAEGLAKSLRAGGACIPSTGCATLHVRRSCESTGCSPARCDTTFNRVFHNDFVTALVGLGYPVAASPAPGATVVDIDIQAIAFAPNRPQYRYAGEPVEIAPGLWARRDRSSLLDGAGAAALRTEDPDTNWYRTEFAAGATPRNELVITVSALSAARTYVARDTRVYYTADADASHYFCAAVGKDDAPRARTWTIPVVGDCAAERCAETMGGVRR